MASWVVGRSPAEWDRWFAALRRRLGSPAVVCKPAADGCSTGVKILRSGGEAAAFMGAVVRGESVYRAPGRRADLSEGHQVVALPVPAPTMWLLEQGLTEVPPVPLPPGDLNRDNLAGWFDRKRFVELTCAVLERGQGLAVAEPSVTVAAAELTVDQKFQQGVGTNLALSELAPPAAVESLRRRIGTVADALGLAGYGRIDGFWDRRTDELYILEANTLCGLTEATVFYSQWLADPDPLPPWAALAAIVRAGAAAHAPPRPGRRVS
jgi:hypothetical protein